MKKKDGFAFSALQSTKQLKCVKADCRVRERSLSITGLRASKTRLVSVIKTTVESSFCGTP